LKNVLILGVNGFIGHHLSKYILAHTDWHIYGMDLQSERVSTLLGDPKFHFVEGDITINLEWVEYHVRKCDVVLPLVAIATPATYVREPLRVFELDFEANLPIIRHCVKYKKRVVFPSTSEVYGDPQVHPQPETYWGHVNPIGPRGVYDEAKRYAEALTMAYHRQQGVDTAIVRIFNTFGSRMRAHDGRAIPTFVRQALANEPLTVFGDGSQTRSFCYVDDLVRGLTALAQSGEHLPVNIGNPAEYTLLELAQTIVEVTGATSEIVFEALPVDDPKVRQPDITRARQLLGWEPQISLEDGLRRMLQANSRESLSV